MRERSRGCNRLASGMSFATKGSAGIPHGRHRLAKRIAIVQSNYIPWKGYFDLIASVDEFILYDDVQYTRRDWRNRNLIKTPTGLTWLTVPVDVKGKYDQTIREARIAGRWADKHWTTLTHNYGRAACFAEIAALLEPLYLDRDYDLLSDLNETFIAAICGYLGIGTRLSRSSGYELAGDKSERLASLCEQAGASVYISGPAAKTYLDETLFSDRGIAVEWFDYSDYPAYPQLWGAFEHGVSVLDLMFNCGADSTRYMRFAGR